MSGQATGAGCSWRPNQYLKFDAHDVEVLETRLRAAQAVGNPQEIARYHAQLKRTYN